MRPWRAFAICAAGEAHIFKQLDLSCKKKYGNAMPSSISAMDGITELPMSILVENMGGDVPTAVELGREALPTLSR
jgi:hypothetical protein